MQPNHLLLPEKSLPPKDRGLETATVLEQIRQPEVPFVPPLPSADFSGEEEEYFNFEI